jgi:hypothetical protein
VGLRHWLTAELTEREEERKCVLMEKSRRGRKKGNMGLRRSTFGGEEMLGLGELEKRTVRNCRL